jgi:hypothetical protein
MEKENRPEFDKIEIQLNRSLEMPGNKMEGKILIAVFIDFIITKNYLFSLQHR